jgi:hypothetical protein
MASKLDWKKFLKPYLLKLHVSLEYCRLIQGRNQKFW